MQIRGTVKVANLVGNDGTFAVIVEDEHKEDYYAYFYEGAAMAALHLLEVNQSIVLNGVVSLCGNPPYRIVDTVSIQVLLGCKWTPEMKVGYQMRNIW